MLFIISWKNIWRNKLRSGVVVGAMVLGVWALIFLFAFTDTMTAGYVNNAIKYDYGHIQIHDENYASDPSFSNSIGEAESVEARLFDDADVAGFSSRIIVSGMVGSANSTQGGLIYGIDPASERAVTFLDQSLVEGQYFTEIKRNPVLISAKMAEKLKVKLKSKVVLTFQDSHGNITAASFRVEGIFKSKSPRINEGVAYVQREDLARLVDWNQPQEVGVTLKSIESTELTKGKMQAEFAGLAVDSYKDLAPDLEVMKQQTTVSKTILMIIIMLALVFGIINTMLMAVLERTREIGMLMAIGMKRVRVFSMIMLETILISIAGAPIGMLFGYLTLAYFGVKGIDFSEYADSLAEYGMDTIYYLDLAGWNYGFIALAVVITSLIGALFPARRATKLQPVEALRKL